MCSDDSKNCGIRTLNLDTVAMSTGFGLGPDGSTARDHFQLLLMGSQRHVHHLFSACRLGIRTGPPCVRHGRSSQGARLSRSPWRLGSLAGLRDGWRDWCGRRCVRRRAQALAIHSGRTNERAKLASERSTAAWRSAACCSVSVGALRASVPDRVWWRSEWGKARHLSSPLRCSLE